MKDNGYYAKKFGWAKEQRDGFSMWKPPGKGIKQIHCPPFTTSLDAIVGEIERRGLVWNYEPRGNWDGAPKHSALVRITIKHGGKFVSADIPALALCEALNAYLGAEDE